MNLELDHFFILVEPEEEVADLPKTRAKPLNSLMGM